MRKLKFLLMMGSCAFLLACGQPSGDTAWKQSAVQASSTLAPQALSVVLSLNAGGPLTAGVAEVFTATTTGGTPPYKYTFAYSSTGASGCPNNLFFTSSLPIVQCSIAFSANGVVSVQVTDITGATVEGQAISAQIPVAIPVAIVPAPTPVSLPPAPAPVTVTATFTQAAVSQISFVLPTEQYLIILGSATSWFSGSTTINIPTSDPLASDCQSKAQGGNALVIQGFATKGSNSISFTKLTSCN